MKPFFSSDRPYYLAALLLLPPALLIHLGLMTFIDDESIRSLVALEMKLSGNYVTPTLNGEYYYNKPPLYNWILLVFFNLAGRFDEFTARIPTLLSLLGFAATVFVVFRPKYGTRTAFVNALVLITCGRILFWDSILGLIDICFSWVMFGLFMTVYHAFRKGRFWQLFLLTYLLTAIGFLMKGLPALVFQACTLSAYFLYKREFRRLFSAAHFAGIGDSWCCSTHSVAATYSGT
ncbi:MAG TPA: glycosyltransferase family 39 protein, partial [Saprospiraceae bacterium]|nr:glycosyltransferase family 39 protein [Saprospiraceae bacterium]